MTGMYNVLAKLRAGEASELCASGEGPRGIPGARQVTSRKGYSVPRRVARPRCWTGATRWSTYPTLNSGLRSLAGATVGLPQGGARHAFTVDALQEWGTGCRILRL